MISFLRSLCFASVALIYITVTQPGLIVLDRSLFVSETSYAAASGDGPNNSKHVVPSRALLEDAASQARSFQNIPPPRILLGIFTTNSPKETDRRNLIRKTYLSNYQILAQANLGDEPTICSLADLMDGSTTMRSASTRIDEEIECQIVYTFVMGASTNTTDPTDLTEEERKGNNRPYIVDRSESSEYERDVLYLNIQENLNDGKTATWFKYATTILPAHHHDLGIDLVFKVDSDAVLVPRALLENLNSELSSIKHNMQRPAKNVYGGTGEVVRRSNSEVPYMQGGFYFLSTDVAARITSTACPRADIVQETTLDRGYTRSEDREVGIYVARCWNHGDDDQKQQQPIQSVILNYRTSAAHNRAYKDSSNFRVKWKEGLATDIALLQHRKVQEKYSSTNGCPPTQAATEEEIGWFDQRDNMKLAKQRFARRLSKACDLASP